MQSQTRYRNTIPASPARIAKNGRSPSSRWPTRPHQTRTHSWMGRGKVKICKAIPLIQSKIYSHYLRDKDLRRGCKQLTWKRGLRHDACRQGHPNGYVGICSQPCVRANQILFIRLHSHYSSFNNKYSHHIPKGYTALPKWWRGLLCLPWILTGKTLHNAWWNVGKPLEIRTTRQQ